jgi:guanylate kinase
MQNSKTEKVLILGKSGAGKDHLLRGLVKKGLKNIPKYTTRPKRKLERDGIDYHFVSNEQFEKMISNNEIIFSQRFNVNGEIWYYGFSRDFYKQTQVMIITPDELNQLSEEDIKGTFIVYLDIDIETRRKRISNRNDNNDSIERRLSADELDFSGFKNYDMKITDPEFEAGWVYDMID